MPSKRDRQTATAERQHAPCCSWAVIISYLGTKPRQTSYYQYSTALRDTDTGLGIHSTSSGFLNKIMAGDAQ